MRYVLLTLSSLLLFLFMAGSLAPGARPAYADNPNAVCADFNGDGHVGIADIGLVVQRFGMTDESPDWDPRFDLHRTWTLEDNVTTHGEGAIEMVDIAFTVAQFGDVCSVPAEKILFETIAQGTRSGIEGASPQLRVARSGADWEALWEEHWADMETPPLPALDFENEMAIAVVNGAPTGGQFLFINGVLLGDTEWVVRATQLALEGCGALMITQPYHIVRVPRTELPVSLSLSTGTFRC